jgi:hypothetical protein
MRWLAGVGDAGAGVEDVLQIRLKQPSWRDLILVGCLDEGFAASHWAEDADEQLGVFIQAYHMPNL